jgi:hypothetical protein
LLRRDGNAARSAPRAASADDQILAILDAPLHPGETALAGFARKEQELRDVFARLSVLESRATLSRLVTCKPSDDIARKFAGLTVERRGRLLSFLADARRRAAMGAR